ncbi:hypothetical protein ABIC01_009218, partial [Bradyrhizobium sp. RT4b]
RAPKREDNAPQMQRTQTLGADAGLLGSSITVQ